MSGGVVCYIERALGGTVIARMRLVAAGLSRTWTAPEPQMLADGSTPTDGVGAALASTRAGAAWIADTLSDLGLKRLARVCVDADGSVCSWLSAPSADQAVIEASIMQGALDAGSGDGAGLGAGRLLAMATPGESGPPTPADTSVQALADVEEADADGATPLAETPDAGGRAKGLATLMTRRSKGKPAPSQKTRYAVLAVPDAPVRVLLDELDQRGVEVETVCSLWHGMAQAWDEASGGDALVSSGGVRAIVLIDPAGRAVWAWSRLGRLLAGGTMRLAARRDLPTEAPGTGETLEGARRIVDSGGEPEKAWEFTPADAGRLTMDWLSWSVQLGVCPRRVVCLATPTLGGGGGGPDGAAALARGIAAAWPSSTVDSTTHPDPIGATVARLAGLGNDDAAATAKSLKTIADAASSRTELVPLAGRVGRTSRSMYRWMAIALVMLAAVIGALGWQLGLAAERAAESALKAKNDRTKLLETLDALVPNVSKERDPAAVLETRVRSLRESAAKIRPPRPVLAETARVLKALDGEKDIRVTEFEFSAFSASVRLLVPDAETGPRILDRLKTTPGELPWTGQIPTFGTQRQYVLQAQWPLPAPVQGGTR